MLPEFPPTFIARCLGFDELAEEFLFVGRAGANHIVDERADCCQQFCRRTVGSTVVLVGGVGVLEIEAWVFFCQHITGIAFTLSTANVLKMCLA